MARKNISRLAAAAVVALAGGLTLAAIPGPGFAASASSPSTAATPFRIVPSPVVGSGGGPSLRASTAISANDVWAVGESENSSYQTQSLAEHWNGSAWSVVPTPQIFRSQFTAVSAASSTDVWAIGTSGGGQQDVPFTEHWNGKTWSVVPLKDPTATNNNVLFTGVKAISPTNVYAIGAYQGYQDPVQFIEHWNGSSWKVLANPFDFVIPSGIDASSAGDIWIVGQQRYGPGGFTEHFNGTTWSVVATPTRMINAIVDVSPTDAWSTGNDITHWDGRSWKVVVANVPGGVGAITSLSANDLWAVGSDPSGTGPSAEHFNGTSWSVVKTPTPTPPADSLLFGISSAGGHVYAVGSTNPNTIGPSGAYNPGTALILEDDKG